MSRAADYIAIGASRGAENFLAGLEKRRDEEKREAKEFKSLADFAEASGLLSKDQAMVMDKDSLKGFVQGKMWAAENTRQNQEANIRSYATMQKLAEFMQQQGRQDSIEGFQQDYSNNVAMGYAPNLGEFYENPGSFNYKQPPADLTASFTNAMARNPGVDPNDLNAFMSSYDKALPAAAKQWAPTEISKKLAELRRAKTEGRDDDVKILEADINKDVTPSGMRLEVDKDGRIIFSQGSGDLTTSTRGQVQQRLIATEKAASMAGELQHLLRPENVGVAGWAQQVVVDEKLAQMFPELANTQNVDTRTLMGMFAESMLKTLKADAMLNQKEEQRILSLMPSRDPLKESFPSAMTKLQRVMKELRRIAQTDAESAKMEVPKWALEPDDIQSQVRSGKMSITEGRELIKRYHPGFSAQ